MACDVIEAVIKPSYDAKFLGACMSVLHNSQYVTVCEHAVLLSQIDDAIRNQKFSLFGIRLEISLPFSMQFQQVALVVRQRHMQRPPVELSSGAHCLKILPGLN